MKEYKWWAGGCDVGGKCDVGSKCDDAFESSDGEKIKIIADENFHFKHPKKVIIYFDKE